MRRVTYSMSMSLDGYIVGPDGGFDWPGPDPEVFRFWIDEIREVGVHLIGRRLYETMLYWETADDDPCSATPSSSGRRSGTLCRRSCSPPRCRRFRAMPAWPPAASRRKSGACARNRGRATSRSAARRLPTRRPGST